MKSLAFIHRNSTRFSVGDFYPVLSVFSYQELGNTTSPFLLLDHLGPGTLVPADKRRGVNQHPHRGFETVTLMFEGELEHRDSSGGGGIIAKGDVQWMTAASGVMHREQFSPAFRERGGAFEMVQLWINLPAKYKMTEPRYQSLKSRDIPTIKLEHDAGTVRVIAGQYQQIHGPALTYSPISVLDIQLHQGQSTILSAQEGETTLIYLRSGQIRFTQHDDVLDEQGLAVMSNTGKDLRITALHNSKLLLLSGQPLNEPINGHGPFVMNSYDEILQAYDDIKHHRFIRTPAKETNSSL
ncbi:pirin family protein [Acinetobacter sp. S40]|uniref:pirin family protein n=1 Tax=unclassified Acinetobacter TaxID=196816 RepID=UPI00190C2AAE|nr:MULTISPECIES: pirin family protein [unclassified Acinetobacter]MBJ9986043.1 pirin family protein [Acinetobacter sp. S40]MBK0064016.1 pirin family protein [Acinetobacter sp. S55]MBK0067301.1 pirin family protein [Acinetobacter sp. S54]